MDRTTVAVITTEGVMQKESVLFKDTHQFPLLLVTVVVTWCSTYSQPVRLYQGDTRNGLL